MRRLLVASVAAAGLAAVFAHPSGSNDNQFRRRKTLGFGPVHPHSVYHTLEPAKSLVQSNADPRQVAKQFVETLMQHASPANEFVIRDDSYTDKATGVSHIYVRQYFRGVEVADGNINLNIKDGVVLSYGDSFYRGLDEAFMPAPERGVADAHSQYCNALLAEFERRMSSVQERMEAQSEQVILGASSYADIVGLVPELHEWNCAHVETPMRMASKFTSSEPEVSGPTRALLQFMIAATPDQGLAQNLINNPDEYLQKMSPSWETHFTGGQTQLTAVIDGVPDTVNPVKARMAFVQVPHGDATALELVWKFEVEMEDNWYEAAVSAAVPHRIVSVVDWASDSPMPYAPIPKKREERNQASYFVFPWGINDPTGGNRSLVKENFDSLASPIGWHSVPAENDPVSLKKGGSSALTNYSTTVGNNVIAHENWQGQNSWQLNYRPDGGEDYVFNYTYDPKVTEKVDALEEAKKYINNTVTQLFYTSNMVHDLYYRYGFDEVSGNFQQHNFGRGGRENDGVIANAQDGSGYNNANFMTPPDGQNGRCRMYLWNTAIPYRDGDLEAGIVIHELSHGLSTRLTGGPANSGCLGWGEAGGMGEGWGDYLATTIRSVKNYSDYAMGDWAANRPNGIRNYPYSLNETINPSTYKTLDSPGYWGVHAIGEVWAELLWVVSNDLIAKHGFTEDLFPPKPLENGTIPEGDFYRPAAFSAAGEPKPLVPKHGNSLMVQLVLNGMKLQPCSPSFLQARDAIIEADRILTDGENECTLWKAFARRGLGKDARVEGRTPWGGGIRTNGYLVPNVCEAEQ